MFQELNNHSYLNHCSIQQTTTSTINQDQPRNKTSSATVTFLDNNAECSGSISCGEKNQSNKLMKRVPKDLSNTSKMNSRDRNDNTRTAAKAVPVPSSTVTRQKVNGSRAQALNPQYSYKPVAVAKSDAESGDSSRINIFAVVFQVLKVSSLLFPYFIKSVLNFSNVKPQLFQNVYLFSKTV